MKKQNDKNKARVNRISYLYIKYRHKKQKGQKMATGKEIAKKAIAKMNKKITNEIFLIIQNDKDLMKEYLKSVEQSTLHEINKQIGRAVKDIYKLENDESDDGTEENPTSTLISTHQKFLLQTETN